MFPNIGELSTFITIEQPTTAEDGFGHKSTTWTKYSDTYAQKRYKSGGERVEGVQKQAHSRIEFWMHYDKAVTELMRINDCESGEIYDITFLAKYRQAGWMKAEVQSKPTMAQGNLIGAGQ